MASCQAPLPDPADGFYEWTVGSDGKKHPIHFHLPGLRAVRVRRLWTSRTDEETGEITESCTIITTRPNELVAPVHDRMPVILPAGAEAVWLDPTISEGARPLAARAVPGRPDVRAACFDSREQRPQRRLRPAAAGRRSGRVGLPSPETNSGVDSRRHSATRSLRRAAGGILSFRKASWWCGCLSC